MTPRIKGVGIKKGANVSTLNWQIIAAAGYIWGVFHHLGHNLVITSGTDSTHGPHSLHYSNNAIDIRTRDLPPELQSAIFVELKSALDNLGFDIVLEKDHIHLEFDPKPGDMPIIEPTV